MNIKGFVDAFSNLQEDRQLEPDIIIESLKEAFEKSYIKNVEPNAKVRVNIDPEKGIHVYSVKEVVEEIEESGYQVTLEEAHQLYNPNLKVGDVYEIEVDTDKFGRLAATQVKHILRQKIREAEKQAMYELFADKKDDIVTGIIDRVERGFCIVNIGKTPVILPAANQIPGEVYVEGKSIKIYVSDFEKKNKGNQVIISRTEPALVKRLFELEVPEIYDGTVEIKSVSRDPGDRCKIAVHSNDANVDAIGSCVGGRGARVQAVINELNGEKIDIIEWNEDPAVYIVNALSPAQVTDIIVDEQAHSAIVIVPNNQLSLAIGRRGQNAKLAARLTSWRIDIKSETEATEANIPFVKKEMVVKKPAKKKAEKKPDKPMELPEDIVVAFYEMEKASLAEQEVAKTTEKKLAEKPIEQKPIQATNEVIESKASYEEDDYDYEDEYDSKYDEEIDYDEYDKYYDED